MITVGVDLAAEAANTGVALMEWSQGEARLVSLKLKADDDQLLAAMVDADKIGIDCPFGWPIAFIDFIAAHQEKQLAVQIGPGADWRQRLAYRSTDLRVMALSGIHGLSVSTDRIGITTMRCAALMSELAARGQEVDRTGAGHVVEVYPGASLVRWGFNHRRYKRPKNRARLSLLVDALTSRATWLDLGGFESLCKDSDDAFDAVIASLTARAAALGYVEPIPTDQLKIAAREGWIALPTAEALDALAGDASPRHKPGAAP